MTVAVLDIETRVDQQLLQRVFFPGQPISVEEALRRFRDEQNGRDFMPLTLHVPISIAVGMVDEELVLSGVETLAADYSEERLAIEFWRWLEAFDGRLVTFNGRGFDLPVLELAALRWGISAPGYFNREDSPGLSPARHFDLCEYLSNRGAVRLRGGMDLLLKMIGLPGKLGLNGAMVQDYYEAGRLEEIHRYCRSDVIQTYFLFLRVELLRGRIDHAACQAAWSASSRFLDQLATDGPSLP